MTADEQLQQIIDRLNLFGGIEKVRAEHPLTAQTMLEAAHALEFMRADLQACRSAIANLDTSDAGPKR